MHEMSIAAGLMDKLLEFAREHPGKRVLQVRLLVGELANIELEQLRFDNKFTFKIDVDPQLLNGDYKVPSLLAQPYIENAILHGLAQSESESLCLTLSAKLENEYIIYTIIDNGIGRELSQKYNINNRPGHKSIGLKLIEERINVFNRQQNSDGGVVITDLYDNNHQPCGTRIDIKIKAI